MTQPDNTSATLSRKVLLTDRALRGLKPAPKAKRIVLWDVAVPSLCVRVTDTGAASFNIMRRIKGHRGPIRRVLGIAWRVPFPAGHPLPYSLAQARNDAREMLLAMSRGIDPRVQRERARAETFASVAELFIARHVLSLKSGHEVEAAFRRELFPALGHLPVAAITRRDIVALIEGAAHKPYVARHWLAYLSRFFVFAIERDCYGITASPCTGIKIVNIVGKLTPRQRVLTDAEIKAVWGAAGGLGYPVEPFVRMLLLTGQRLREIAEMTWDEIDLGKAILTLAPSRTKTGVAFEIPLASESVQILKTLPRFGGPFVVSACAGLRPITGFGRIKARMDGLLPAGMLGWRFHDLRRTMRTGLSGLPIPNNVAELCIGHTQPGLHKVYDRHSYRDEKRRAFELWAARLMEIVGA